MRARRILRALCVTLALLIFAASQSQSCPAGWYGATCEYKCRCATGECTTVGLCNPGVKCAKGWFGPECQYSDLAYNRSTTWQITDGDDSTCGSYSSNQYTVDLGRPYLFTWLRVRLSRAGFLQLVSVNFWFNSSVYPCRNMKKSILDNQTIDIHCDQGNMVRSVNLSGNGARYVCSLYVSGGRNIALKQITQQTTTYAEGVGNQYIEFTPDRAVDGKSDPNVYTEKACAILERDGAPPWWNVILPSMHKITRFVIYGTVEIKSRIAGFILECFLENGNRVFQYVDPSPISRHQYIIVPPTMYSGVRKVVVRHTSTKIAISLCEVEVYGDSTCGSKRFGHRCEHTCGCAGSDTCSVSTRRCPAACAPGYEGASCDRLCPPGRYGNTCSTLCSYNCQLAGNATARRCDPITGRCLSGCKPGYIGDKCQSVCPAWTYGQNCENLCSYNCKRQGTSNGRVCHPVTGICMTGCEPGFTGNTCLTECPVGMFGENCRFPCSNTCRGRAPPTFARWCDHVTGTCIINCITENGHTCETVCPADKYGNNCSSKCATNCAVMSNVHARRCHVSTGGCLLGCAPGYTGGMCTTVCPPATYGNKCLLHCSSTCLKTGRKCDTVRGVCQDGCEDGYVGLRCETACLPSKYGKSCESSCSSNCQQTGTSSTRQCDFITGSCLSGCKPGYTGLKCQTACPPGKFGINCASSCSSHCQQTGGSAARQCDLVTGRCLGGCRPGFTGQTCQTACLPTNYGNNCTSVCSSSNCQPSGTSSARACDLLTGICLNGCKPGYFRQTCNAECYNDTYGQNCTSLCNNNCMQSLTHSGRRCNHITGACLGGCAPGYYGQMCQTACSLLMYGFECSSVCSTTCVYPTSTSPARRCDFITGKCLLGCQAGYTGFTCQTACEVGRYGNNCSSECSSNCKQTGASTERRCDLVTGSCLSGCLPGYKGQMCQTACLPNEYGTNCSSVCSSNCQQMGTASSRRCDVTTGSCLSGCMPGYTGLMCSTGCQPGRYGNNCTSVCSNNCQQAGTSSAAQCDIVTGTCPSGCTPGYTGQTCQTGCHAGRYGNNCTSVCSSNCQQAGTSSATQCDIVTGRCPSGCTPGYTGQTCQTACQPGRYGTNCTSLCSSNCQQTGTSSSTRCDFVTGTCLSGCMPGYTSQTCQTECQPGRYGDNCTSVCSSNCQQTGTPTSRRCDFITGRCLSGCEPGFYGQMCQTACPHLMYGYNCSSVCSSHCVQPTSSPARRCESATGQCLLGCEPGYTGFTCSTACQLGRYGNNCTSVCSSHCKQAGTSTARQCDLVTGRCLNGCMPGYKHQLCETACLPVEYGTNCTSVCSSNCQQTGTALSRRCDATTGRCLTGCMPGYTGLMCQSACQPGRYGNNCTSVCSSHCQQTGTSSATRCDFITGRCLSGCMPGYNDQKCETACQPGTYGTNCTSVCSSNCQQAGTPTARRCDFITGRCLLGCQPGYTGQTCGTACPSEKYGYNCSSQCSNTCVQPSPSSARRCDFVTGKCLIGCKPGYTGFTCLAACQVGRYGDNCTSLCSSNCKQAAAPSARRCDFITGSCLRGCNPGYTGQLCQAACQPGSYGNNCTSVCNSNCQQGATSSARRCDHVTGRCLRGCLPGYTGLMCQTACQSARYGNNCTSVCSSTCKQTGASTARRCDVISGTCLHGCMPGYTGQMCQTACQPGKYGNNCTSMCSSNCKQAGTSSARRCDFITGRCLSGCMPGYTGQMCQTACQSGTYGNNCTSTCSSTCKQAGTSAATRCDFITGRCPNGCMPGYTGLMCQTVCQPGRYGNNCTSVCNSNCQQTGSSSSRQCDFITGRCLSGCKPGYASQTCQTVCPSVTYGNNCSSLCSSNCQQTGTASSRRCDFITGRCLSVCKPGYVGLTCQTACQPGRYGNNCTSVCSSNCKQPGTNVAHSCDFITGRCLSGCKSGYIGLKCQTACQPGRYGDNCTSLCSGNCRPTGTSSASHCNFITGMCPSGCLPGYTGQTCHTACLSGTYGDNCTSTCSSSCRDMGDSSYLPCNFITGACPHGCLPGYSDPACKIVCEPGRYGDKCLSLCNSNCRQMDNSTVPECDFVTGECSYGCKPGYVRPMCQAECDLGTYGDDCLFLCSSSCRQRGSFTIPECDFVTGECPEGCLPGFIGLTCKTACEPGLYGDNCMSMCSGNCQPTRTSSERRCDYVTGECVNGCLLGYSLPTCETACELGRYGNNCMSVCSSHCWQNDTLSVSECDFITGECPDGCEPGYASPTCQSECQNEMYGENCTLVCSSTCQERGTSSARRCHHITGRCLSGCVPGYTGEECETDCEIGKYGQDCMSACSVYCVPANDSDSSPCHPESGVCYFGCELDLKGPTCSNDLRSSDYGLATIIGLLVLILATLLLAIAVCVLKRRPESISGNTDVIPDRT